MKIERIMNKARRQFAHIYLTFIPGVRQTDQTKRT